MVYIFMADRIDFICRVRAAICAVDNLITASRQEEYIIRIASGHHKIIFNPHAQLLQTLPGCDAGPGRILVLVQLTKKKKI